MSPDKEGSLKKMFPVLFKGAEHLHCECDDGWFDLLSDLCGKLEAEISNLPADVETPVIHQIKEKFGGLRFYMSAHIPKMSEHIREAETKSVTTCEVCGDRGSVVKTKTGWYRCLCLKCKL